MLYPSRRTIYILKDIHAGVCGHHASSRPIAAKAFRTGFYWLTTIEDAKDSPKVWGLSTIRIQTTRTSSRTTVNTIVLTLRTMGSGCGRETAQILARRARLHVGSSRQIHQVGRTSPGNNSRLHSSNQLHQIHSIPLWVPHSIIIDNGANFTSKEFKNYCGSMGIKLKFASSHIQKQMDKSRKQTA
jgi:hypothetical protein